ncbi:Mitochondrial outer membrane porin [Apostasia shenzhenica]|uniref:Mitochondrial outer membrane porin n=1 Tax=Apostasia shenzhenica TaxID=1088818 RepID=A0A2I0A5Y7_9ASPA|nr:Mitochondrial outer membrane porin [Apostasia shenzhenica]
MAPGLYSDIGKKTRDLLCRDFLTEQKVTITTYTANGAVITATGTKKNDFILGEIQSQLKNKNVTVDLKANSESNVLATFTIDELGAPGLKSIFSFVVPDQKSGKIELQYLHDYAGINTSLGLTANPIVNFSGVVGTSTLAVGADVSLDTATGNFTKYNAGVSITNADLIASLNLNNKGDLLSASYYHLVRPFTNTAVGAELTHSFSTSENTLTFGTQHSLDPLTTFKARFDNYGKASALIQHQWRPKSFLTLSAEVDTKAIEKSSKIKRPCVAAKVTEHGFDDYE